MVGLILCKICSQLVCKKIVDAFYYKIYGGYVLCKIGSQLVCRKISSYYLHLFSLFVANCKILCQRNWNGYSGES